MQNSDEKTEDQQPFDDDLEESEGYASGSSSDDSAVDNDYLRLRRLLLGEDYSEAINRFITREANVDRVVDALPEALKKSSQHDLGEALAPVLDQAMEKSIEQNPSRITNILFPIMGPAIRKAVSSSLAEMVQTLNTLLEQSLSFSSIKWRILAWRAGMPYAQYALLQTIQYRVEQVLLVHKDTGLLLNSVTAPEVEAQDPELVSSMLTAISDFVSDSFSAGRETLERVRFGDLELLLYVGPLAVLAIAVRGSASDELFSKANTVIEEIHSDFAKALNHFEGDREEFEATDPILAECLLSQKVEQKPKGNPWMAVVLILGVLSYISYQSFNAWQLGQQFKQLETAVNNQAGYVVISTKREDSRLYVKAIRSPESQSVKDLELALTKTIALDLNIDAHVVHFGPLPKPVVKVQSKSEVFQTLINKVQSTIFYFDIGEIGLSETELLKIPGLIDAIEGLESLVGGGNLQIILMGFADGSGSSTINNKVSQKRADEIKAILTANKVSSDIIVTWGVGHLDRDNMAENVQRRVTLQVVQAMNDTQQFEQASGKEVSAHIEQQGERL